MGPKGLEVSKYFAPSDFTGTCMSDSVDNCIYSLKCYLKASVRSVDTLESDSPLQCRMSRLWVTAVCPVMI